MPSRTTTSPMASHTHSKRKTKHIIKTNENNDNTSTNTSQPATEKIFSDVDDTNNNNNDSGQKSQENDSASLLLYALQTTPRSTPSSPPSSSPSSPTLSHSSSSSSTTSTTTTTTSTTNNDLNLSGGEENTTTDSKCMLSDCALCVRGVPTLLIRSPTWASIMRVVFFCLQYDRKDKVFFNLKTDIYGFIISHWDKLSLNKKRSDNWHKQIQDMLSHSKNLFESGMEKYKQNGFWRMKQNQDPWTMHKPRSYNWTKRASRSLSEGADSEYITVFDVATGAVVHDGDLESPRKKIKGEDDSSDDQKQNLEDEIRSLKEALAEMTESLYTVKEELKRKDQEMLEKAYTYHKTLEQLEALKLAHHSHGQNELQTINREPHSSSPPPSWQESYSPRTAYRHNMYSAPPSSSSTSLPPSLPPSHSRPIEPSHYPSHLVPPFTSSSRTNIFSPFDHPHSSPTGSRRFSPPSLPFPPHTSHISHSQEMHPYIPPPHYSHPPPPPPSSYQQPPYEYKPKYPLIFYFVLICTAFVWFLFGF